jgi:hypothetical protein
MLYDPTEHRIRSFVTRAGRLSTAQARSLEELGPKFLIQYRKRRWITSRPSAARRRWCWRSASAWAAPPRTSLA